MNIWIASIALTTSMTVCSVSTVSALTQTDTPRERDASPISSTSVARGYVAAHPTDAPAVLTAPRLLSDASYDSTIDQMLARSATFRRQYARLIRATHVSVVIKCTMPAGRREAAITRLSRTAGGKIEATVHISPSTRLVELIAHEFEHILEHLDGVDLNARSRLPASGVWRTGEPGTFETSRAIAAGQRVALEVSAGTP